MRTANCPLGNIESNPYEKGQIIINLIEDTGSEQQIYFENGIYKIECVGGGSAGNGWYASAVGYIMYGGGGSGAGFVGEYKLFKGIYKYRCGNGGTGNGGAGGNSYILRTTDSLGINANGGQAGSYANWGGNEGGILSITESQIINTPQVKSNGNKGTDGGGSYSDFPGGPSVYDNYGAGGNSRGAGSNGLLKITYLRLH